MTLDKPICISITRNVYAWMFLNSFNDAWTTFYVLPYSNVHIYSKFWRVGQFGPRVGLKIQLLVSAGTDMINKLSAVWASYQMRKIVGCACTRNAGNVFPATHLKGNRKLTILACIAACAARTYRDACRDRQPVVARKTFPVFPSHAQPAILVNQ